MHRFDDSDVQHVVKAIRQVFAPPDRPFSHSNVRALLRLVRRALRKLENP